MKFKLELNLDDLGECQNFINTYGTTKGRMLANLLGLKGTGSTTLADALSNFAWNAHTAHNLRMNGDIARAYTYEDICDKIYNDDIHPICDCW